jgi:hypothetical protein
LENIQNSSIKDSFKFNYFFIPLLEYKNIGIVISQNNNKNYLNVETMNLNFNSIVKQKFILKSILIIFDLSFLNITNNSNCNQKEENFVQKVDMSNLKNNDGKKNEYNYEEATSSSSHHTSPKFSDKHSSDTKDYDWNYYNLKTNSSNNNIILYNNLNFNNYDLNNKNIYLNEYQNIYYCPNQLNTNYNKKNYNRKYKANSYNIIKNLYDKSFINNKYSYYENNFNINSVLLNANDIFSKTLFNRYQNKFNSTCNLQILIEFLKIKIGSPIQHLTIYDFFSSFNKISTLSLVVPLFKNDSSIIKYTLTPSLHELKLFITNQKIIKKIGKEMKIGKK